MKKSNIVLYEKILIANRKLPFNEKYIKDLFEEVNHRHIRNKGGGVYLYGIRVEFVKHLEGSTYQILFDTHQN
jgi:hypothetical protein